MHREKKQRESVIFPRRCKIQKIPLKNRFWIDFWMEVGGIEIGFDGTFRDSAEIRFLPLPLRFLSSPIIEAMMIEKASPPSPLSIYIYTVFILTKIGEGIESARDLIAKGVKKGVHYLRAKHEKRIPLLFSLWR